MDSQDIQRQHIINIPIRFRDRKTGEEMYKGKRPCVVINTDQDHIYIRTMTSQINKKDAKLYGVPIKKNLHNNLKKDSAILCTKYNSAKIDKNKVKNIEKIGQITEKQLFDTLSKSLACNRQQIQMRYRASYGKGKSM